MRTPPPLSRLGCLVYRVLQRGMTLDVTHLMLLQRTDLVPGEDQVGIVELRLLGPGDIRDLAADPSNELDASLAGRLGPGGDTCVAAFCDGRLASYGWYARDAIEAEHNRGRSPYSGTAVRFPRHMAFLYKGFTHPDFRGRGIYGLVHQFALQELSAEGVTAILATADWSNNAALRSCYRLGFRYLGRIWRFGWGRWVAGVYPRAASRHEIQLGQQAVGPSQLATAESVGETQQEVSR